MNQIPQTPQTPQEPQHTPQLTPKRQAADTTASRYVAMKMEMRKQESGLIGKEAEKGVIDTVIQTIMDEYKKDPEFKVLPS